MKIEIKKSKKPVEYNKAINFLERKLSIMKEKEMPDLIWALEHPEVYTAGTSFSKSEVLDNSINLVRTNRGGKITYHGPGQSIFYFVIDLNKKKKDIRKFINIIENTIIGTLKEYKINSFADKDNTGVWVVDKNKVKKIAAIGIRVSKWIAFHGFSININNDLNKYKKIIPCGITDKGVTNLKSIKIQDYKELNNKIIDNFIKNLAV
jgi:lipoyl(octanoyl) transferase